MLKQFLGKIWPVFFTAFYLLACNSTGVDVNSIKTLEAPSFGDSGEVNKTIEIGKEQAALSVDLTCDSRIKNLEISKDGGDLFLPAEEIAKSGYDLDCSDRKVLFEVPTQWFFTEPLTTGQFFFLKFQGRGENGLSSVAVLTIKIVEASTGDGGSGGGTGSAPQVTLADFTDSKLSLSDTQSFLATGNCSLGGESVRVVISQISGTQVKSELVVCSVGISTSTQTWSYSGDLSTLQDGDYKIQASQTQGGLTGSSEERVFSIDKVAPLASISAPIGDGTQSPFVFTIEFDELPHFISDPFTASDFTVTNGTLSADPVVDSINGKKFSMTVNNLSANSNVKIILNSNSLRDEAGNTVASVEASKNYTLNSPGVTLTTTKTEVNGNFTFDVAFSEAVTDFTSDDLLVTKASVLSLTPVGVENKNFQIQISPNAVTGEFVTIQLPANKVIGAVTQVANQASNLLSLKFDNQAPSGSLATLTPSPSNQTSVPITLTFSENIEGLQPTDFQLVNATLTNLQVDSNNPKVFTFDLNYVSDGLAKVSLPAGAVSDIAGNLSSAVAEYSHTFDRTLPTPLATQIPVYSDQVILNIDVADNNGEILNRYKYAIGETSTLNCSSASYLPVNGALVSSNITDNVNSFADGSLLKLCLLVSDLAGNWTPVASAASYTWIKDASPRQLNFSSATSSGNEGLTKTVTVEIADSKTSKDAMSFKFLRSGSSEASSDWVLANNTYTIASGQTSVSVSIDLVDDSLDEEDESLVLQLTEVVGNAISGATASHELTVIDLDAPPAVSLTLAKNSVGESEVPNTVTLTASLNALSGRTVTVPIVYSGSATLNSDYTVSSSTISILPGVASGQLTISMQDDASVEGNESISASLGSITNAVGGTPSAATLTIVDDESAVVTTTLVKSNPTFPTNVTYGTTASFTYTISNPGTVAATTIVPSVSDAYGAFSIDLATSTCDGLGSLAAGASCQVVVIFRPQSEGLYNGTFTLQYFDGASTQSLSDVMSGTGTITVRSVVPVYAGFSSWNKYIKYTSADFLNMSPVACAGSETGRPGELGGCLHAGEMRKIETDESSCDGLSIHEMADNFQWQCGIQAGKAVMYSSGLRKGKGLVDLITYIPANGPLWRPNSVVVYKNNRRVVLSPAQNGWWDNVLMNYQSSSSATAVLSGVGKIYVIPSILNTGGLNITADEVAIVVLPGFYISWHSSASALSVGDSGETTTPTKRATVSAGSQKFLWIEGTILGGIAGNANFADFSLFINNVSFSRFNNIRTQMASNNSVSIGIYITNSNQNIFQNIRSANNASTGFYVYGSHYNIYDGLSLDNNGRGGVSSADGFSINNSTDSVVLNMLMAGNPTNGMYTGSSFRTVFSHLTAVNNGGVGTGKGLFVDSNDVTINQAVIAKSFASGLEVVKSNNIFSQIFLTQNQGAPVSDTGTNAYHHNFIFGSGTASCVGSGINNCAAGWGSTYRVISTSLDITNIFKGLLTSIDWLNPLTAVTVTVGEVNTQNNFVDFYSPTVGYANSLASGGLSGLQQGRCGNSGYCSQVDWRISETGGLFDRSGAGDIVNEAWVDGGACPTAVNGNDKIITDASARTFLVNALEIRGDLIGNENGLCESGESCVYTPHFGAMQGGDFISKETCVFQGTTVSGVKMHRYLATASFNTFNPRVVSTPSNMNGTTGSVILGSDNLSVVSKAEASNQLARGTVFKNSGKYYFEVHYVGKSNGTFDDQTMVGLAQSNTTISGVMLGTDMSTTAVGLDLALGVLKANNNTYSSKAPSVVSGDTLMVAVSFDGGMIRIWYGINGEWYSVAGSASNPATNLNPGFSTSGGISLTPAVSLYRAGVVLRANFGQRPFRFTPPSGFTQGWY